MNGRGDQKQSKQQALTKKFPNVYALLFILCTVAMLLTWIVPAGAFDRVASGKISRVIAGSFHYIKDINEVKRYFSKEYASSYISRVYKVEPNNIYDILCWFGNTNA